MLQVLIPEPLKQLSGLWYIGRGSLGQWALSDYRLHCVYQDTRERILEEATSMLPTSRNPMSNTSTNL